MYPERLATLDVQVSVSQDYIGGLRLTPDGLTVVAAAADGVASLLEMRKAGARLSYAACGGPLRCAETDGHLALLGNESGQVTPCRTLPSHLLAHLTFLAVSEFVYCHIAPVIHLDTLCV